MSCLQCLTPLVYVRSHSILPADDKFHVSLAGTYSASRYVLSLTMSLLAGTQSMSRSQDLTLMIDMHSHDVFARR